MRILDRYILKNFLVPFLYCFLGFIAIWLAFDLAQKTGDLVTQKVSLSLLLYYYGTQIPQYIVLILPAALLLALLYSLSKMSRSNEIISMHASGMSLYRLVTPLILTGIVVAGLCFAMNYKLAPHAEVSKDILENPLEGGEKYYFTSLLFRNRADERTWYLQLHTNIISAYERAAHPDLNTVKSVEITQQDKQGNITRTYYAHEAAFDPATHTWTFSKGMTVNFNPADASDYTTEYWDTLKIKDWSETPRRVFSTDLEPANLSLPELRDYLHFNSDFPDSQLAAYRIYFYRQWAVPAGCIVIVFIAAPLGIVYSRRGVLAGVAGSIFIFFGTMFFEKLFLALGKHGGIPPLFAAWGTDMIFGVIGLVLLYLRAGNRDILKLHPKNFMHLFKQV
jgi:lipopolysaccharide export system permease protein